MVTLLRLLLGVAQIPIRLLSAWFVINPHAEAMRRGYERDRLRVALASEEEHAQ